MNMNQLTRIFCQIDDFCKTLDQYRQRDCFPAVHPCSSRGPAACLMDSEIMTILIAFQFSGFRNFKHFYLGFLSCYWRSAFPKCPSYTRFIEIMKRVAGHLILFSQVHSGKKTGIYYIDSTCLPTCHLKRSRRHKTFNDVAEYGRTSVGWFFGLKMHLVINDRGELIAFKMSRGNQQDAKVGELLLNPLQGLAFGDKGYIGKALFSRLLEKGLKLITRKRKNMTAPTFSDLEKQLLNQRGLIETVIGYLKFHYQIWHTRHRSVMNAVTHLVAALASYTLEPLRLSAMKSVPSSNLLT